MSEKVNGPVRVAVALGDLDCIRVLRLPEGVTAGIRAGIARASKMKSKLRCAVGGLAVSEFLSKVAFPRAGERWVDIDAHFLSRHLHT